MLLQLDDGILLQRLLSRGRDDDNEAVIRNRLEVYREQTAPLIAFYRQLGLIREVEAEGAVEAVASRVSAVVSQPL